MHNAVSDSYRTVSLQYKKDNKAATRIIEMGSGTFLRRGECDNIGALNTVDTILMDDLLEVVTFSRAIMKVGKNFTRC